MSINTGEGSAHRISVAINFICVSTIKMPQFSLKTLKPFLQPLLLFAEKTKELLQCTKIKNSETLKFYLDM